MKTPKISVIIPTYNRYTYLLKSIDSVKNQTYKNIELIIVNDGSSDENYYTGHIEKILPEQSLLVHSKTNSSKLIGPEGRSAYTRNLGINIASGDYLAFLDDDDIWLPTKIEKQLKIMEETKCKFSCTEGYIGNGIYDRTKHYPKYITEYFMSYMISISITHFPPIWDRNFLLHHNSCITSSVIISKDVIDKIGKMPYKRIGEDYEYWLRALEHTNCAFIEEPLIYYDLNHGDGSYY